MSEKKITKETLIEAFQRGTDYQSMDPETQLCNASSELKSDREVMFAAVDFHGWLYEYASDELKSDKELALKALDHRKRQLEEVGSLIDWEEEDPTSLICKHFDKSLWKDKDIVKLALELYDIKIIENRFIHESLLKDKEFIVSLNDITDGGGHCLIDDIYNIAHASVKNDRDVALKLLEGGYMSINCFNRKMLEDKGVILKIISTVIKTGDGSEISELFELVPNISKDKDMCLTIVRNHHYNNLIFVDPALRIDADIIQAATSNCLMNKFKDLRKDLTIVDRERMAYDIANNFIDELEFMEEDPAYWIENRVNNHLENKS